MGTGLRKVTAMGYDVHITRAKDWVDSENAPIALDEGLATSN